MKPYMRIVSLLAALLILGAVAPIAWADGPVTAQVVQIDKARFPEVDVYVSATDAAGQPVRNLPPEAFSLEENGQPMSLSHVSRAGEQGPVAVVLVIDHSGSMREVGKMDAARQAASAFVRLMRPGDVTGVIIFDTEVTTIQPLTNDQDRLAKAITSIRPNSDTAVYDALYQALEMLHPVTGRKAIILVTDGLDNRSRHTREEVLALTAEHGVSIYTIGLGDRSQGLATMAGIDEAALKAIADGSGGTYAYAPDPTGLSSLYELLSRRIQNEYRLTYTSPNRLRDGARRSVTVTVAGATAATATYNPGGVIPEAAPRPAWGLFAVILLVLAFLLVLPTAAGKAGELLRRRASGVASQPDLARVGRDGRPKVRISGQSPSLAPAGTRPAPEAQRRVSAAEGEGMAQAQAKRPRVRITDK
jgi:Ca-activated chloride channel family protein